MRVHQSGHQQERTSARPAILQHAFAGLCNRHIGMLAIHTARMQDRVAVLHIPARDMPFADMEGFIARLAAQPRSQIGKVLAELAPVVIIKNPVFRGRSSGEPAGPRRAANRVSAVSLLEGGATSHEPLKIRRLHPCAAESRNGEVTHLIHVDEQQVRLAPAHDGRRVASQCDCGGTQGRRFQKRPAR